MAVFFKSKKINNAQPAFEKTKFFKKLKTLGDEQTKSFLSNKIFKEKVFLLLIIVWLTPLIFALIYSFVNYKFLPNQIPLFYSFAWGENQLSEKKLIFLPVVGAMIIGIINLGAGLFRSQDRIFSYLFFTSAVLISFLASITTFNIINLMR